MTRDERAEVLLLNLGGTVSAVTGPDGEAQVLPESEEFLRGIRSAVDVEVSARQLAPIPSSEMTIERIVDVARVIQSAVDDGSVSGVVVAQGTDTLEETAFALDVLLDVPVPIVVTGAMRQSDWTGADGPANLVQSIRAVSSSSLTGSGVMVVMADEIHRAATVTKTHTSSVRAFASPAGPSGWVSVESIRLEHPVSRTAPPALLSGVNGTVPRVPVYTASVGDGAWWVEALAAASADGVVVQGFGGGHVPVAVARALRDLSPRIPVVVTSRCGAGVVVTQPYTVDGRLVDLLGDGAVSGGVLTAQKARLLLSLLLMSGVSTADIVETFAIYG